MSTVNDLKRSARYLADATDRLVAEINYTPDELSYGRKMSLEHFIHTLERRTSELKRELEHTKHVSG